MFSSCWNCFEIFCKMAFAIPLNDIDESFFKCPICLNELKEPKLLPCLHRCCRDCLEPNMKGPGKSFRCPKCNYECRKPAEGLDGLKTDLHMQSILHFNVLKKSVEKEGDCANCTKKTKRTAYCFQCMDYLCDECYRSHITRQVLREHWEGVVVLKDVALQEYLDKELKYIASTPMCHIHSDRISHVCCGSCGNIPLCITCIALGEHICHDRQDVTDLARVERKKFEDELKNLNKFRNNVYSLPSKIATVRENLTANAIARKETLQQQYNVEDGKITKYIEEINAEHRTHQEVINNREKEDIASLTKEMEAEIEVIKDKYSKLILSRKAISANEIQEKHEVYGVKTAKYSKELGTLRNELIYLKHSVDKQQEHESNKLVDILNLSKSRIARYDTIRSSASIIFATQKKWADVCCIPYVRSAYQSLVDDGQRMFPKLKYLAEIEKRDLPSLNDDRARIPDNHETVVHIERCTNTRENVDWWITSMTTSRDGCIFITSDSADEHTNTTRYRLYEGELRQHNTIPREVNRKGLRKAIPDAFSHSSVILPFEEKVIRIYDVSNDSYTERKISSIVTNWPHGLPVMCVVPDYVNKQVLVCSYSRDVYVLNNKMKYIYVFPLPEEIGWPSDIAIHKSNLLVCDSARRRAHIVTMEGTEVTLHSDITKPDFDGGDWGPISVCFDKKGFIYMLWDSIIRGQPRCNLLQFNQNGRVLLQYRPVESDSHYLTIWDTNEGEKLVVATWSKRLYIYGLIPNEATDNVPIYINPS